ncbi:signal peptide peptidase [Acrasis kona]|uniref:Signal peptide peptidase n=1 Tax=Acrasis kona TaxID=1008807 RepID=A0AAW2YWS4_9EUKA
MGFASSAFGLPYLTPICEPGEVVLADPLDACTELQSKSYHKKFVLTKRGTCTFVTKARIAEASGASGVIIWNRLKDEFHHMSDDGTGKSINIRNIMINPEDGQKMYDYLNLNVSSIQALMGYCPLLKFDYYN